MLMDFNFSFKWACGHASHPWEWMSINVQWWLCGNSAKPAINNLLSRLCKSYCWALQTYPENALSEMQILMQEQSIHWLFKSQGWEVLPHADLDAHILNPSTSAKPAMTKLQNVFVVLVNISFRWYQQLVYLLLTKKCYFCCSIVNTFFLYAD